MTSRTAEAMIMAGMACQQNSPKRVGSIIPCINMVAEVLAECFVALAALALLIHQPLRKLKEEMLEDMKYLEDAGDMPKRRKK